MLELKEDFKKQREIFSSPVHTLEAGIVAVGESPSIENLYEAYSFGIFPWPHENYPLLWFCPDPRGVLDFSDFHIPRSTKKDISRMDFSFSWNRSFKEVMENCRDVVRTSESGTWITDELVEAYTEFHREGYAHSVEVWLDRELVGGLYGVCVGKVFSAESMFFKVSPASKASLIFCVESLRERGLHWMDLQMVSSVSKSFGAKYISKRDFLKRLPSSKAHSG